MALPPNFLDELRARTPVAALIGKTVKLTRSGRDTKGCCPFHNEKTPSFYVYDDHYHCFGCGEHGDAITFTMKTSGAGFMEAVETLANQAGLDVPKASPQAAEAEQKRAGITDVLAAVAGLYRRWLYEPQGEAGLAYLRGRGLTDATIKQFGLGWSGEGRGAVATALKPQGITTQQLVEAGVMKDGERGPASRGPVDMFFARVMFPILDRRGGIIGFSGRLLGDGVPKYVNGPETPVFSKRRSLYGLAQAREPVRRGQQPLILVEGQMDVIALHQAGFSGAVAPLGTAFTEEQLEELWRLTPEPVICFDADAAGRRAALRAVDLALAALAPDRSLKFLRLPEKDDPDSLIRRDGAAGFRSRLDQAERLSALLFDMLAEGTARDTPEARAAFRTRLIETANRIPDKALAGEYRAMLLDRFFAERKPKRGNGPGKATPVRRIAAGAIDEAASDVERAFILTAILIRHPTVFHDVEEAMARLTLPASCNRMVQALHEADHANHAADHAQPLDMETLLTHLAGLGQSAEARQVLAVGFATGIDPDAPIAETADAWWHFYNLMHEVRNMLLRQRDEERAFFDANPADTASLARLTRYTELLRRAQSGEYGPE